MKYIKNIYYTPILYTFIVSTLLLSSQAHCLVVSATISCGELIDKITILIIKSKCIANPEKLKNVRTELETLQKTCDEYIDNYAAIAHLQELLQEVNQALWDIEDAIRIKERNKEFDDEFITLARSVYMTNDKRCMIKKQIDEMLGSHITEEKSYENII